jgi:hypothetical protein
MIKPHIEPKRVPEVRSDLELEQRSLAGTGLTFYRGFTRRRRLCRIALFSFGDSLYNA